MAAVRQKGENQDRQRRRWNAAASQAGRDLPVDVAPAVVCNGKNCYSLSTPRHRSTQKGGCFGLTTRLQCICKGGDIQYGR